MNTATKIMRETELNKTIRVLQRFFYFYRTFHLTTAKSVSSLNAYGKTL